MLKSLPDTEVVAQGESNKSLDDALGKVQMRSKKIQSTVYEQKSEMIVYGHAGQEEVNKVRVLITAEREVSFAAPMVMAGSRMLPRAAPRAAPPAGLEPTSLSSTNWLM